MPVNKWAQSTRKREPAVPGKPVIDPAGWHREEEENAETWIYWLSADEIADVQAAVAGVEERSLDIKNISREDFPLPVLGPALATVHDDMVDGRGFVLLRGLPVGDMTRAQSAAAFWGIGTYFGEAVSQNAEGHLLGHVKDLGKDSAAPSVRNYQTRAQMGFHADRSSIVGLLCLHPAKSGGASRIASSITLYNVMLERRPDLAAELTGDFYWTRHGEESPGEKPYHVFPVYSFDEGYLSCRGGAGSHVEKAQRFPEVPRLTAAQREAMKMFRELAEELAMDMTFNPGDIQFLYNHVTVHSRAAFEDWPEPERQRHLLRLWLVSEGTRPLSKQFAGLMDGVRVADTVLKTPLRAE